jgi:hypothetical protein
MKTPHWIFHPKPGYQKSKKKEGNEFDLAPDQILRNALREAVQNAIDASNSNKAVQFALTIGTLNAASSSAVNTYLLKDYMVHLDQAKVAHNLSYDKSNLDFILLEDWNTTGLIGDQRLNQDPDPPSKDQAFYYFFRTDGGITAKNEASDDLGSRGHGKAIFNFLSQFRICLTSSTTKNSEPFVLGTSELAPHTLPGHEQQLEKNGYFGLGASGELSMPFTHASAAFMSLIPFKRETSCPGTSHFIPLDNKLETTLEEVTKTILTEFAAPILLNKLEVNITFNDDKTHIDRNNFQQLSNNVGLDRDAATFINLVLKLMDDTKFFELPEANEKIPSAYLQTIQDTDIFQSISTTLDEEGIVKFRLPFTPALRKDRPGHLEFVIHQPNDWSEARSFFLRDTIRITNEPKKANGKSCLARLTKDAAHKNDASLISILATSENVAHTTFVPSRPKFAPHRKDYLWLTRYCSNFTEQFVKSLNPTDLNADTKLLAKVLPFKNQSANKSQGGQRPPQPPRPIPPGPKKAYTIQYNRKNNQLHTTITNSDHFKHLDGQEFLITFKYKTRGGGQHKPEDFDLRIPRDWDLYVPPGKGCFIKVTSPNQVILRPTQEAWSWTTYGWSKSKKLIVSVSRVPSNKSD